MMGGLFSIIEMLSVFLIYNVIFNKSIKKNFIGYLAFSIFNSVIFHCTSVISFLTIITLSYFINTIAIYFLERKRISIAALEYLISYLIFGAFEFILYITVFSSVEGDVTRAIIMIIYFATVIYLIRYVVNKFNINIEGLLSDYTVAGITVINFIILVMLIKVFIYSNGDVESIFIDLFILSSIMIITNIYYFRELSKIINERNDLKIKENLSPVIGELVDNFRATEHEYKNHLTTVYSMVQLNKDSSNSKSVMKYIDEINSCDIGRDLLYINNDVIKAVLYNKSLECAQKDIDFQYEINSELEDLQMEDTDIVILISNLLNNAIEAVMDLEEKEIYIVLDEEEKYIIEVKNSVKEGLKLDEVEAFFKKGYSTKGKNRGYGLYNIKKIVEKYKGKIQLSLDENYLNICIII